MTKFKLTLTFFCVFILLVMLPIGLTGSAQQTPFKFDSDKIEPGTLYTYELYASSKDSNPDRKNYYFIQGLKDGKLNIEGLTVNLGKSYDAAWTEYTLDMEHMMLDSYHFRSLMPRNDIALKTTWKAAMEYHFQTHEYTVNFTNRYQEGLKTKKVTEKITHIPTFFYNTRHVDLWTIMRFYPLSQKKIDAWNYTGNKLTGIKIKYQGNVEVRTPTGEMSCYKFELSGKGILAWLFGKKAWLWMNTEDERNYMVRYKNNNERGNWPMMELHLIRVESISEQEWQGKIEKAARRDIQFPGGN